jgi:uncharacterized paraquat-inducible protein A
MKLSIDVSDLLLTVLAVLVLMLIPVIVAKAGRPRSPQHPRRTVTVVSCLRCSYSEKRIFSTGDYVGKKAGTCPRCGSTMIVEAIYDEELSVKR